VSYRKYRGIAERVVGVPSGVHGVAVLRAGGAISRGSGGTPRGGGVKNEDFVRLVRAVRLNKAVKAVVLRVDR
jgi:ClpP class serine protease